MIPKSSSCIFFNFVELIGFSFVFISLAAVSQSGSVGRGPNLECLPGVFFSQCPQGGRPGTWIWAANGASSQQLRAEFPARSLIRCEGSRALAWFGGCLCPCVIWRFLEEAVGFLWVHFSQGEVNNFPLPDTDGGVDTVTFPWDPRASV